jgi:hypothetical protein
MSVVRKRIYAKLNSTVRLRVACTVGLRLCGRTGQRNVDDAWGHELVLAIGLRLSILHALLVEESHPPVAPRPQSPLNQQFSMNSVLHFRMSKRKR